MTFGALRKVTAPDWDEQRRSLGWTGNAAVERPPGGATMAFGPMFAAAIRKRRIHHRSFSQWRWHLDEIFVRINGETHYLWRAVDHEGEVLEVFVTKRRDRGAALKFLKRRMKRCGRPRSIVTDRRCRQSAMPPIRRAVGGSTIGLKTHTNRSDDEKQRWHSSEM